MIQESKPVAVVDAQPAEDDDDDDDDDDGVCV